MKGRGQEPHVLWSKNQLPMHTSVLSEQKRPEGNLLSVVETQTEETSLTVYQMCKMN